MQQIKDIKKTIDSANVNFLIGSGLSSPFLEILNDVETRLSKAEADNNTDEILKIQKEYFEKCMLGNLKITGSVNDSAKDEVLKKYEDFYRTLNHILLERENSIMTKQVNVFTTNIDVFSEIALENTDIEYNDGFHGKFKPKYSIGNFKKSYLKKSLHYENTSEIPVFNILKLHGSLSWRENDGSIYLDRKLSLVSDVEAKIKNDAEFGEVYKKLRIVNPTKKKFEDTTLNQQYYDLLRVYSNELEKENSVLFVMGFSFADEHIQDLTFKVANSNPTLKIYIFNHGDSASDIFKKMSDSAKNKNIEIILPAEGEKYNFETVTTKIFDKIVSFEKEDAVPKDNIDE